MEPLSGVSVLPEQRQNFAPPAPGEAPSPEAEDDVSTEIGMSMLMSAMGVPDIFEKAIDLARDMDKDTAPVQAHGANFDPRAFDPSRSFRPSPFKR